MALAIYKRVPFRLDETTLCGRFQNTDVLVVLVVLQLSHSILHVVKSYSSDGTPGVSRISNVIQTPSAPPGKRVLCGPYLTTFSRVSAVTEITRYI